MRHRVVAVIVMLALGLFAVPLASDAQQAGKVARIGYLSPVAPGPSSMLVAFQQGLGQLGWVEGKNLAIEYRWAEGKRDQLPELAAELVRLNVEVIVTWGPGGLAAQQATGTIPIVIASTLDAVQSGVVASLARPGGNITGLTLISTDLMGKRLELLKEAIPTMITWCRRGAVSWPLRKPSALRANRPYRPKPCSPSLVSLPRLSAI